MPQNSFPSPSSELRGPRIRSEVRCQPPPFSRIVSTESRFAPGKNGSRDAVLVIIIHQIRRPVSDDLKGSFVASWLGDRVTCGRRVLLGWRVIRAALYANVRRLTPSLAYRSAFAGGTVLDFYLSTNSLPAKSMAYTWRRPFIQIYCN